MAGQTNGVTLEIPPQAAPPKGAGHGPPGTCNYPYGQCTYYVAMQYPSLTQMGCLGNACQWWNTAQKYGWTTNPNPWVGAVVVYNCNLPGSGGDGHVAVVTQVSGDGSFQVQEMNWAKGVGGTDTRRVYTGDGSRQYVLGFIAVPGGPSPSSPGAGPNGTTNPNQQGGNQNNQCPKPAPATGANGGTCQLPIAIPGIPISIPAPGVIGGPWTFCLGGWSICIDGVAGIALMGLGLGVMVLGAVLGAKEPVKATIGTGARYAGGAVEIGSAVTGQPEGMAAGAQMRRYGRSVQQNQQYARRAAMAQAQFRQQRRLASQRLSVQQQQARRDNLQKGMTSVQATRAARDGNGRSRATRSNTTRQSPTITRGNGTGPSFSPGEMA